MHRPTAIARALAAVAFAWGTASVHAQGFSSFRPDGLPARVSEAELVAGGPAIPPGGSLWLAVHIRMAGGWHTYWRNPGDAGAPTQIEWTLPPGFEVGPVVWPAPHLFRSGPLASYGYEDEAWLLTRLTAPPDLAGGAPVAIAAVARYLVCAEICVPQEAFLTLRLPAGDADGGGMPSADARRLERALAEVPVPSPWPASFTIAADEIRLRLGAPGLTDADVADVWFFPAEFGLVEHAAPQQAAIVGGDLLLTLRRDPSGAAHPAALDGVLVVDGPAERRAVAIHAERVTN